MAGPLVVAMALFGLVFVGNAVLLRHLDPLQLVVWRFLIAAGAFLALFLVRPAIRPHLARSDIGRLVACAVLAVTVSQIPVAYGQQFLAGPLASLIISSAPVFIAILSAWLLHERFTRVRVLGLVVALLGVVVVVSKGDGGVLGVTDWRAAALVVLTPMAWAAYTVLQQPLIRKYPPLGVVGLSIIVGSLTFLPVVPHAIAGAGGLSMTDWLWLGYLGIGGTMVPYVIWFGALRRLSAGTLGTYMYLVPLFALGWSVALLGQVPSITALAGGLAILAGVFITQVRVTSRGKAPALSAS